jgi:hypothetical protein
MERPHLNHCSREQFSGAGLGAVRNVTRVVRRAIWSFRTVRDFLATSESLLPCPTAMDADGQVHWSRHLLARLSRITGAELLIGVLAVLYNPHFQHFVFPSLVTSGWQQHRSGHRFQHCSCWTPLSQRTSNNSGRKWQPTEPLSGYFSRTT